MARKPRHRKRTRKGATRRSLRRNADFILATMFGLAVAAAGLYAFYNYVNKSTYFLVKTIKVEGCHRVDPNDVVAASGISNEDILVFLATTEICSKVNALPYVEKCRITRIFPDMVAIKVVERTPVATLFVRNQCFEIDAHLNVLRRLDEDDAYPGPLITQVPDLGAVQPGAQLTQAPLREALDVWLAFSQTNVAKTVTVSEIAAPSTSDIRMFCDELPYEIRWGRGNATQEAMNFDTVWQYKNGELNCREYLDLRFDRDVACL